MHCIQEGRQSVQLSLDIVLEENENPFLTDCVCVNLKDNQGGVKVEKESRRKRRCGSHTLKIE